MAGGTKTTSMAQSCLGIGILALAGCGDTEVDPARNPLTLTQANANAVVAKLADMNNVMAGAGGGSGQVLAANLTASIPSDRTSHSRFNLADFASDRLQKFLAVPAARSTVAAQLVSIQDAACAVSGTFSYSWNDKDNSGQLSVGDDVSGTFKECVEEPGVALNGGFSFVFNGLIGNPATPLSAWWMSANLSFDQLRVTEGSKSWVLTGRQLSFIASTQDGITYTGSLSGASLTVEGAQGSSTLGTFVYEFTHDKNTLVYTTHGVGTLADTQLGGRVTFLTLQQFKGAGNQGPTEGSMRINGAKNADATVSRVTFTAVGNGNVRVEVDSNGDNVVDQTSATTWSALGV